MYELIGHRYGAAQIEALELLTEFICQMQKGQLMLTIEALNS